MPQSQEIKRKAGRPPKKGAKYTKVEQKGNSPIPSILTEITEPVQPPKKRPGRPRKTEAAPNREYVQPMPDCVTISCPAQEPAKPEEERAEELIKSICVEDGKNKIEITLAKSANRMYRMEFFINGLNFKPSTFSGATPAMNFWNLLLRVIK
jgi:hypothetical protein